MSRLRVFCVFLALAVWAAGPVFAGEESKPSLLTQGKYVPDIATFLNIGACSPTGFSWDGKDVYFISTMSGEPQVYRLLESGWPYRLTTFEDGISFFQLSYDGDAAIVGAAVGGDENYQLYLMDTETGRLVQLTKKPRVQYGSVTWTHDDRHIYYRSNEENGRDFFIYRMDIATGESEKIFDQVPGFNVVADLSRDDTKLIIGTYTSNVNNDLRLLDLPSGEVMPLTKDDKDVFYDSPTLMPDNKTIWLTCNDNEDGMSRLATMTVGSYEIQYVDDGWLDTRWECVGVGFSRDFRFIGAATNEDGYIRLKVREVESKKEIPAPPLEGILGFGGVDKHGNALLSFSSATRAPDVWKWNTNTGEVEQLTFSTYAGIDRTMFQEPQLIRYKSFDGLEVPAFLYLPPGYEKGNPVPFVVEAHGGPEGQYQPAFIRNVQYLMLSGFGVIAPNLRGSTGYGIDYLNLDNYKKRKDSLKDYKAAVEWLIANGYTEQGMIGIRGGSYGGYVTMGMITEYPDLFSAAVNVVGIVNFKSFLERTADYRRHLREAEYGPLSDPEFLEEISPIHKADRIRTPLLVVHGENDPRVPVFEARQILDAVSESGVVVDSLIFPDEGHGTAKRENTIAEYRKQVEFFNRFLKSEAIKEE